MSVSTAPPEPAPASTSAAAAPTLLSRPYRALTVGAVALAALVAFEALAVATAMPTVAHKLGGLSLYAVAFGGTMAAGVLSMVVSGIWNDARGPVRPLWTGIALFVVGLLVVGAAQDMWTVVAGRIVQGLGSGLYSVSLYVMVGRAYPDSLRPKIFAAFAAAWVLPSIVGPAITGLIVEHAGWRWVFLAAPLLAVPAALLIRRPLSRLAGQDTEAGAGRNAAGRIGWAVLAAASAFLLQYGGQRTGVLAAVLLVVALAGLAVSVPRLLPRGTFRLGRGLPTVIALRAFASAAFTVADVFIPLMLSARRGLSPAMAGLALTIGALFWSAGSWLQARPGLRLSTSGRLRTGLAAIAVGGAIVGSALIPAVPVALAMAGWAFAGLGMGIVYPTLSVLTLRLSAPDEEGTNSSGLQLADWVAGAAALAVTGSLFAALVDRGAFAYVWVFATTVVLAVAGALVAHRATAGTGG